MQNSTAKVIGNGFSAVIFIMVIAYPLLSFFGAKNLSTTQFAWGILITFTLRSIFLHLSRSYAQWPVTIGIIVFCLAVIFYNSEALLLYYPVLMNAGIGLLFLVSLNGKHCLIEQFLLAAGKTPPARAVNYIRGLCVAWGIFLLINASIAAYTACCTNTHIWAMYNGAISYIAIAAFCLLELAYRAYYKKAHGHYDDEI